MKLTNSQLQNFISKIKLKEENMPQYRDQMNNLKKRLGEKINNDDKTGVKVTRFIISGSWKKRTILRATGDHPIDVDLVLYVEGDESLKNDIERLHDFVVGYLSDIYPTKDIFRDVDAEGKTKSVKIKFIGTGLELDIVPVVPLITPKEYVWQPERGGGGRYITSVTYQLDFSKDRRINNPSITSIIRAVKWWRNYKELKPTKDESGLPSFAIELIASYLDITLSVEENIEEGIIRFFQFISNSTFPVIKFPNALNEIPEFDTPIFIADPTNNENNAVKKMTNSKWLEIKEEANNAWEALNIAQSKNFEGDTVEEWKHVFGPSFTINAEE
jgi:hypothetical protein